MKKFFLYLAAALLLAACGASNAEPGVTIDVGNVDGTITVPAGCAEPCNSVLVDFSMAEVNFDDMFCWVDFGDGSPIEPMTHATHTYIPGRYDVITGCEVEGEDQKWINSATVSIKVPLTVEAPQSAPAATAVPTLTPIPTPAQ